MRRLAALLIVLLALLPPIAEAQQQIPVMPPNTVWGRIGQNQIGPGGAIPFSTLAAAIAGLITPPAGYTVKPVSGSTTLDSTYCNNIIVLAIGGFTTLSLGPASGFSNPCWIRILNTDPSSGKKISVSGLTNGGFNLNGCGLGNLCPGQSIEYLASGTTPAWSLLRNPGAWRPVGTTTLNASTTGVDTNDCLSVSTPCTLSTTCFSRGMIDPSANPQGQNVAINIAAGIYTAAAGTLCDLEGNHGASSTGLTQIVGAAAGTVIFNVPLGGIGIYLKDLGEAQVWNISFIGGSAAVGIQLAQFSVLDLEAGNTFGNMGVGGTSISASQMASVNLDLTFHVANVSNNCPNQQALISLASNASVTVASGGVAAVFDCAAVFNGAVFSNQGGFFDLRSLTFSGTGLAGTSGIRMGLYASTFGSGVGGCVYTGTGGNLTAFGVPGNSNNAFPVGSCTDFPITAVLADLPTCNAGITGRAYEVSDSSVNTWGTNYAAGGANVVTIRCNGTSYTVAAK